MEQTECSETSAYKIQAPGNYPEENIQHTEDVMGNTGLDLRIKLCSAPHRCEWLVSFPSRCAQE